MIWAVSTARFWYLRMDSSSIWRKERACTTFLRPRRSISPLSNLFSSSTARLRRGMPCTSARNSSDRIETSGFFRPAAAKMSTTPSEETAREINCRSA